MTRLLTLAVLAVGLGASAQNSTGISQSCTSALALIATNSTASACLSPSSLLPLFTGSSNASIVDPINNWLGNVCGSPACTNDSLAAIVTNVTAGCGTELSALGFTSDELPSIISTVQSAYPTVRQTVCLKDGDTNCVTQTLTNVQNIVGNLSLTNIVALVAKGGVNLPSNVTCTNCVKAAYNTVNAGFPGLLSDDNSTISDQCGSSFLDGQTPSGIVSTASNSTASASSGSNNGAMGAVSLLSENALVGMGLSALLTIGSFFAML